MEKDRLVCWRAGGPGCGTHRYPRCAVQRNVARVAAGPLEGESIGAERRTPERTVLIVPTVDNRRYTAIGRGCRVDAVFDQAWYPSPRRWVFVNERTKCVGRYAAAYCEGGAYVIIRLRITGAAGRTIAVRERCRGCTGSRTGRRHTVARDEGGREREAVREATAVVRDRVRIAVEAPAVADGVVHENVDGFAGIPAGTRQSHGRTRLVVLLVAGDRRAARRARRVRSCEEQSEHQQHRKSENDGYFPARLAGNGQG